MKYIYHHKEWPAFEWDKEALAEILPRLRHKQGRLLGKMEMVGFNLRDEASLQMVTLDVLKSSEIEGELLAYEEVRSSVARHLGLDRPGLVPSDREVDGVVEMMLDATQHFERPLTKDRLFGWHAALFPSGRSGMHKITTGQYRDDAKDDPMQVISGALGKQKVHFQAPDADKLDGMMVEFLDWFNNENKIDPVVKAAIAHLWFLTIHPFEDGNGRIARAISDMQLARADNSQQRFYSLSAQIRKERKDYYKMLQKIQRGKPKITKWLRWFLECTERAIDNADVLLEDILAKAHFWDEHVQTVLNDRQVKIINMLFDGFEGKLNTSKYAKINKCSQDTAARDIKDLIAKGILQKGPEGGRSTHYVLTT